MLNSNYANYRNYTFHLLTEQEYDYFPQDQRWNKIGAVVEALHPKNGWARDVDYLVACDADLVVVDYSLDIAAVAAKHPKAHLIMSTDSSDIGNTGFMIVRNTRWAMEFFSLWWTMRYAFACDQHALTDLYNKLHKTKNRVAILPAQSLNTAFPVYKHFDRYHSVLHMVGESLGVRQEVFLQAARYFCSQPQPLTIAPHRKQYNLSVELLATVANRLKKEEASNLTNTCQQLIQAGQTIRDGGGSREGGLLPAEQEVLVCLQRLHEKTAEWCRMYNGSPSGCAGMFYDNYHLAQVAGHTLPRLHPETYEFTTKNLYDSFLYMEDSVEAVERGLKVGSPPPPRDAIVHSYPICV